MIKQGVLVSLVLAGAAACSHDQRRPLTPVGAPAGNQAARASAPSPRPRHRGHVDIGTGLYIREDDDLILPTSIPIILRRTYLSGDHVFRHFGIGATHNGEWWLYGSDDPTVPRADLILADGGRIHFTRISGGTSYADALLQHDSTPTVFKGALLGWDGAAWTMRFRDGSKARFRDCQGPHDVCWLIERQDAAGHRVEYVRDVSGTLLRIESEGQSITFDYADAPRGIDDPRRIIRASDTSHHVVSYAYDERGRLTRAVGSDGTIRTYEYDDRDALIAVREPGRIVENEFDASGRLARQVVKTSENDADPFITTMHYVVEDGVVVRLNFREDDGTTTAYRFNKNHYMLSETYDADGPAPIAFTYDRNESTNVAGGVTISCNGPAGPITRPVRLASDDDQDTKDALMRDLCSSRR